MSHSRGRRRAGKAGYAGYAGYALAIALVTTVLGACATGSGVPSGPGVASGDPTPGADPTPIVVESPDTTLGVPSITVIGGDVSAVLRPWTACWSSGCYDGTWPEDPVDLGSPEDLVVELPAGWRLWATFRAEAVEGCYPRQVTVEGEPLGENRWRVTPLGAAGAWHVDLFGSGAGGDGVVTVAWTTPVDGEVPEVAGTLVVLADHDGALDSYGVELGITGLADSVEHAEATVTVTGPDGRTAVVPLDPPTNALCAFGTGGLYLTADATAGQAAVTALGGTPQDSFGYRVDLVLDGVTYVGTGTWPNDTAPDDTLSVPLTWEPELPRWDGSHP